MFSCQKWSPNFNNALGFFKSFSVRFLWAFEILNNGLSVWARENLLSANKRTLKYTIWLFFQVIDMCKPYFIEGILTNPFLIYPMIIIIYSLIIYMILKDYNYVFLVFSLSLVTNSKFSGGKQGIYSFFIWTPGEPAGENCLILRNHQPDTAWFPTRT